jgi:hypothetical protein
MTDVIDIEEQAARDESRLATIAYWLERYRNDEASFVDEQFKRMLATLETPDARAVAQAWYDGKEMPKTSKKNRFAPIAAGIRKWAASHSEPRNSRRAR